jgi:hypothetical protein
MNNGNNYTNNLGGGGTPNLGGGGPPKDSGGLLTMSTGGELPHSDTSNYLNSNISYNSEYLKNWGGSEILNVKNILEDTLLTTEAKNTKILEEFARLTNEVIKAKKEIAILKQKGEIPIVFD